MEEEQKTTANSNQKENTSTQNNEASTPANNNPKSQNRTNNTKPKRKVPTSGNGWNNDLIKAFEKNEKISRNRT